MTSSSSSGRTISESGSRCNFETRGTGEPLVLFHGGTGIGATGPSLSRSHRTVVEEIVANDGCSFSRIHARVDGVETARIGVVDPGGEDAKGSQLATVLVREDIVGIVGTGSVVTKRTNGLF